MHTRPPPPLLVLPTTVSTAQVSAFQEHNTCCDATENFTSEHAAFELTHQSNGNRSLTQHTHLRRQPSSHDYMDFAGTQRTPPRLKRQTKYLLLVSRTGGWRSGSEVLRLPLPESDVELVCLNAHMFPQR